MQVRLTGQIEVAVLRFGVLVNLWAPLNAGTILGVKPGPGRRRYFGVTAHRKTRVVQVIHEGRKRFVEKEALKNVSKRVSLRKKRR